MNKDVTIVIPSYKSRNLVINKIKNLSKKYKIIIIENSKDYKLKKIINKNYNNIKIILKNNVGFGRAVNIGANIKPVQIIEKLPKGEILNNSLIFIEVVFLNFGGFLFVKSIGIKAIENNKEIKMNGS